MTHPSGRVLYRACTVSDQALIPVERHIQVGHQPRPVMYLGGGGGHWARPPFTQMFDFVCHNKARHVRTVVECEPLG